MNRIVLIIAIIFLGMSSAAQAQSGSGGTGGGRPAATAPFCPTYGSFAPATRQQIQILSDAISNDSRSWERDRYDAGSLQDVCYDKISRPGIITLNGIYTYNKGQIASVEVDIQNSKVQCIRYQLSCEPVRTAVLYAYDNASQASANQSRAVGDAIRLDSQSWLTKQYDVGSLKELRVTSVKAGGSTVQGNFTYDKGVNQGSISAKLNGNVVQCISLEAYSNANFKFAKCNTVRTQTRAQAQNAYRDALREQQSAWRECVNKYVFEDKHDCGSEPSSSFSLGF